ncbi:hypothetical protein CR105_24135 [Massilia eurypsychrophila]|jgi:hypothetical protein|uniref:DUF4127 domain-containing protein n=1 Tax=Massilia eurypsychrophila TaxID=1485217 RepID=A0A2G8T8T4_9BURK|nr:DUF4127 family protein [Massilia eurypsychrophila]PIL42467.1 hypothetical protein CR105_24135 [Massilia eurypsychrophila]
MSVPTRRIAGLPVDARPVVREQVQLLVSKAGWDLDMPAPASLGHLRRPAERDALAAWLENAAAGADALVLSLDMLVYGGLVPSRFIDDSLANLSDRLDLLTRLRAAHPHKNIYAFAATMRMSNNNVNEEEKLYWSDYGMAIWKWSYLSDRHAQLGERADGDGAERAAAAIPLAVRQDYLATRERNLALTVQALDLVAAGVIDRLVLPQDDTADFGFNIAERRMLEQRIAAAGLADKVLVYPGADEVMHTLCAHLVASADSTRAPLAFYLHCSDPANVGALRALYEDRPVLDAVRCQVVAAGARVCERIDDADIVLAVHTRGAGQGDWAMQRPLPDPVDIDPAWIEAMTAWHSAGRPIALVDLAYANGADPAMLGELAQRLPLAALSAYAGWNTASNSIGSLVAQCVLERGNATDKEMLTLRLLEDYLWQAVLRQAVRLGATESDFDPARLRQRVDQVFRAHANAWAAANGLGYEVTDITLPWDRTFEIGLRLKRTA